MSGDLRAAVAELPEMVGDQGWSLVRRSAVLAVIPEGAVLVTEETLAAALAATPISDDRLAIRSADEYAAAILRHLREQSE